MLARHQDEFGPYGTVLIAGQRTDCRSFVPRSQDIRNGCDFRTDDGFERGKQMYATGNPDWVWTSSPRDPFCTFHNINVKRYPAFARRNRRRRQEGMVMCERALWFCEQQILRRKRFAFKLSRRSQGWSAVPAMGEFLARCQDVLFWADCAGCRVDCRCPWSHELLSKECLF